MNAIAITIEEQEIKINEIRKLYDKAYSCWMPHINILYPCTFEDFEQMKIKFMQIRPFYIHLDEIGFFTKKKYLSVHLKSSNNEILQHIFGNNHNLHMTIAQIKKSDTILLDSFKKWLGEGIIIYVDKISFLQRHKQNNKMLFLCHFYL